MPVIGRLLGLLSLGWGWSCDRLDDPEELDGVAQLGGKLDIELGDVADAFGMDAARFDPEAVGQRCEDSNLVSGVVAVDVERRFSFGVAQALSIGQDIRELGPLELHPGEDVVAGAIDDAGDARDPVSGEGFPERLDDGNAPGDGGFVVEVRLVLRSQSEEFWAVGREESLVGGDHRLAQFEGCTDHLACCCHSAHQFDHELDLGIMDHLAPVAGQHRGGYGESARPAGIPHGHADDVQSDPQPSGHEIAVALQRLPDATTHCAATD